MNLEDMIRRLQKEMKEKEITSQDALNEITQKIRKDYNNNPMEDFEGLSPNQMKHLVRGFLNGGRLITLSTGFPDEIAFTSPFLKACRHILMAIPEDKPLKLTATGSLPRWLVREVYDSGVYPDSRGYIKSSDSLYKELDWLFIHVARIICEIAGLARQGKGKQKGKWILTRKGKKMLQYPSEMLAELFDTFYNSFQWDYLDHYPSEFAGRIGFGYTLFLLLKYGDEMREVSFYAEKFSKAFPIVLEEFLFPRFGTPLELFESCYVHRTFNKFLIPFGLVEKRTSGVRFKEGYEEKVAITPLFRELILLDTNFDAGAYQDHVNFSFEEEDDFEADLIDEEFIHDFLRDAVEGLAADDESDDIDPFSPPPEAMQMPQRNEPCPCGSGRKYKKCCLH